MGRIRNHTNPLNLIDRLPGVDFQSVFDGYSGEIEIEFGVGRGVFIRSYAQKYPFRHVVAVDVRKAIIDSLQARLDREGIQNVYLVRSSAQICMEDLIADRSVARCFVFHPDPWFKKRHHKRRMINPVFLDTLKTKLKPSARLYVATDVALLWQDMDSLISQTSGFSVVKDDSFWESEFVTHWAQFSRRDRRNVCFQTYQFDV